MPPTDRFVISFAAEPPQDGLPYGRFAELLGAEFLLAVSEIDSEGEELGEVGELRWFPDRTYGGLTYRPVTARTAGGFEVFGYVAHRLGDGDEPAELQAVADFTAETAEANPDWQIDLNDEVIGRWRGELGKSAELTLIWGNPMIPGGRLVTAELADLAVDQCELSEQRFTMIAPDGYRGDFLEVKLWGRGGQLLATESLYVDDGE